MIEERTDSGAKDGAELEDRTDSGAKERAEGGGDGGEKEVRMGVDTEERREGAVRDVTRKPKREARLTPGGRDGSIEQMREAMSGMAAKVE